MRRTIAALLLASTTLAPAAALAQSAPAAAPPASGAVPPIPANPAPVADSGLDTRLLIVGAGAVLGIAAFNVLTAPLGTVPLAGGALAAVPYETALGSRLLAVLSGGAGAVAATYAWDQATGERHDYGYMAALGVGALTGVALGNVLTTGILGTLPYYAGAGEAVGGPVASASAQAASRVWVIATGALGALGADWLYRKNAESTDPDGHDASGT